MEELLSKLSELKNGFADPDNEILKLAEEKGENFLNAIAGLMSSIKSTIEFYEEKIKSLAFDESNNLESTVALANEFDASDDPFLQHQAQILDRALLVLAESELSSEQKKYRDRNFDNAYNQPREELAKRNRIAEIKKSIDANKPKNYRIMEAGLSARHCPDHPGVSFLRVADYVYQCSLDHKIYDFQEGYSTLKGSNVPGGSIANQWNDSEMHHAGQMGFDTRESKTNG